MQTIMKNKILLAVCTLFSVASFAQQITYGVGAGTTNTGMRGDAVQSMQQLLNVTDGILTTKSVTGFYAGGFTNIPVSENLSIEPGLYYSAKGYELGGSYSIKGIGLLSAHASTRLHSAYIDMPILLKANLNGFQVFAGPQLSYLTSAKITTNAGISIFNLVTSKTDVTNRLNRWDAGLTAGAGYQFSNGIRLTASYEHGLSKVDAGQNTNTYNKGFKLGAGFSF